MSARQLRKKAALSLRAADNGSEKVAAGLRTLAAQYLAQAEALERVQHKKDDSA
jgi:hypothetical protein